MTDNSLKVLESALRYVQKGWSKELAKTKNMLNNPQGEWLPVSLKNPSEGFTFKDADAWSLGGALHRAEFELTRDIPKTGTHLNDMPGWVTPPFSTDAHNFVLAAVKERGYNYLADFNDPDKSRGKTTQADVVAVLMRAIELAS